MKNVYSLFVSFLFVLNLQAQNWSSLVSNVNTHLNDVHFLNDTLGYVVGGSNGRNSVVLKTINGKDFIALNLNFSNQINDIYCLSNDLIHISAHDGLVAKSTDGGNIWVSYQLNTTHQMNSIYFIDSLTGYVAGGGAMLYKTVDGGNTWNLSNNGLNQHLWDICFINPDTGFVAGHNGLIARTTNAGQSWQVLNTQNVISNSVYDLHFPSNTIGYAISINGDIIKTIDGGDNWTHLYSAGTVLRSVFFFDNLKGYACGNNGLILKTINGGISWTTETSPSLQSNQTIFFPSLNTGYAVGFNGSIVKYQTPLNVQKYKNTQVLVYPNPTSSSFNIEVKDNSKPPKSIFVFDKTGRIVIQKENLNESNLIQINTETLKTGVYTVEIYFPDKSVYQKLVID